jgi:hypothetical protein
MARSNRKLTQFTVSRLQSILKFGLGRFSHSDTAGNTQVETILEKDGPSSAVVRLYGKEIFRLHYSRTNSKQVTGLSVHAGGFYDMNGRPTRTTRERLNGILDAMGTAKVIPEGVRVYLDEDGGCQVGSGHVKMPLDSANESIQIFSNPDRLVFMTKL